MVRVDSPTAGAAAPSGVGTLRLGTQLERELDAQCRVELPGVYFAFNSAQIAPASDRALAQVAAALARHPEWSLAVEGHTDSIGTAAANQTLSVRRAEAVRARLAERHKLNTGNWKATGYGASRPRESNATIEGRARNRRVELVRACSERS
jgi:outer membrane protein OmpA-like peptidoglycan-associated protein